MSDPTSYLKKKAREAGARTRADVGVFLIGFAAGGFADGVLNFAGFAEPLLCATFGGAATLGLKKLLISEDNGSSSDSKMAT